MKSQAAIIQRESVNSVIFFIRGQRVILDKDLALLYGVSTKSLNLAVKRNYKRFIPEFMFQLTPEEFDSLRFQFATSKRGGRRYLPYAFTEHGVIMVASILNSNVAINASIQLVKAFVELREFFSSHKELAGKLHDLEKKYDHQFKVVFDAIRELMEPPVPKRKPIGFKIGKNK